MILCRLHDGEGGDDPQSRFQTAVKEMEQLIHYRQRYGSKTVNAEECLNDSDYCLLIFYSGHGRGEIEDDTPDGTWAPVPDSKLWLAHESIWDSINHLTNGCTNKDCKESWG